MKNASINVQKLKKQEAKMKKGRKICQKLGILTGITSQEYSSKRRETNALKFQNEEKEKF